jgi:predicted acylesterase/phospholipase RssA
MSWTRCGIPLLSIGLLIALGGCGVARTRVPAPADAMTHLEVKGFEGVQVRVWGDVPDPKVQADIIRAVEVTAAADKAAGGPGESHVLCMSGGASDGAYGAGILTGWSESGKRPRFAVVSGTSTGAILAVYAFLGPEYDPVLKTAFTTASDKDIYTRRNFVSVLFSDSLYDSTPLAQLIEREMGDRLIDRVAQEYRAGRRVYVQSTSMDAQRPVLWDLGAIAASGRPNRYKLFRQALMASSAIPIAFPPVYVDVVADGKTYDEMHIDGGATTEVIFVGRAGDMNPSRWLNGDRPVVRMDVLRNGRGTPDYSPPLARLDEVAARALSTVVKSQATSDIYRRYAISRRDQMGFAYTHVPSDFQRRSLAADSFNTEEMRDLFKIGKETGRQGLAGWGTTPDGY